MIDADAKDLIFHLTPTGKGLVRMAISPIPLTAGPFSIYLTPEEAMDLGDRLIDFGSQIRTSLYLQTTHGETNDVIS